MSIVVEAEKLSKRYGAVKAVDEVSFTMESNKIYGLLGRNGAGKTTIMQLITAQQLPSGGRLRVFSEDPFENERVLSQVCCIKESQRYPDSYRVTDVLEVAAALFPNWDSSYAKALLEQFRIPLKRRMKKLSRGMLSSVGIVIGLASRAPLTIFDEPYLGLDPAARGLFYDRLIEDYSEHPRTIVLSTHLIDEVSQILEHVLLIDNGRLILDEETDALRGRATAIAGAASNVEAFTLGRTVIHRDHFGGLATAAVLGELTARERGEAKELGLELAPVSLQQLVVHLTGGNSERKAGEVR